MARSALKKKPKPAAKKRSAPKARKAKPAAKTGGIDSLQELVTQRALGRHADDVLEECSRLRLSLRATLGRFLPAVCEKLGAAAAMVTTRNEELETESFEHGVWTAAEREALGQAALRGVTATKDGKRSVVAQALDVSGEKVGIAAFVFPGDRTKEAKAIAERCDVVCEELDGVLASIQVAAVKQDVILKIGQSLRNLVFDRGVDDALQILRSAMPVNDFVLLYHDEAQLTHANTTRYRIYRDGVCIQDSEAHPHAKLAETIARVGDEVLSGSRAPVVEALGLEGAVESVLISGITSTRVLGKLLVTAKTGISTFGMDLLRVFGEAVSQRLVDYNRERRHLAQFFAPAMINELVRDPAYSERYLAPRTNEVGLLYADINSFTKISEQVLMDPAKIGRFVDRWSTGAVEILWKHGGVFDKMVGDCIIGIFGPPFFRSDRQSRIANAVKAAREILAFTVALESDPDLAPIVRSGVVPGLGVAVGVNLCQASVGLFGPNQDFTAFSSGMNATARLQSLAGFREILVMDSARDVLGNSADGLKDAAFEGPIESPVKNVAKPLRYYRVRFPESSKKNK